MSALNGSVAELSHSYAPSHFLTPTGRVPLPVVQRAARLLTRLLNDAQYPNRTYLSLQVTIRSVSGTRVTQRVGDRVPVTMRQVRRLLLRMFGGRYWDGEKYVNKNGRLADWYMYSPSGKNRETEQGMTSPSFYVESLKCNAYRTSNPINGYKPLPPRLLMMKSLVNPRVDSDCFKACLVLHTCRLGKNKTRESALRKHYGKYPFSVSSIEDIGEAMRHTSWPPVNVSVWRYDGNPYLVKKWDMGYDDCMHVLDHEGHCVYISKPHIFLANRRRPVCSNCFEPTSKDHACYQPDPVVVTEPITYRPVPHYDTWGVFDFESRVDETHHPVCYCVSMNDGRKFEHFGEDAASHFVRLAVSLGKATLFAHNAKGYDNSLVMKALMTMPDVPVTILSQTTQRVTGLTLGDCRLVDSLSFLGGSLNRCLEDAGLDCKLPYPYSLFKTMEDYDRPYCEREDFKDELNDALPSEEEYESALARWASLRTQFKAGAYVRTAEGEVGVVLEDAKAEGYGANTVKLRLADGSVNVPFKQLLACLVRDAYFDRGRSGTRARLVQSWGSILETDFKASRIGQRLLGSMQVVRTWCSPGLQSPAVPMPGRAGAECGRCAADTRAASCSRARP